MTKITVNKKNTIVKILFWIAGIGYREIGQALDRPVSKMQVSRVALGRDPSPRVRAEIIKALGMPEDFFVNDYEMTITLTKREREAA